jgi:hypothetical protein
LRNAGRAGGGNLFFQLVNARYERAAMILTSNRGFAEWLSLPWPRSYVVSARAKSAVAWRKCLPA